VKGGHNVFANDINYADLGLRIKKYRIERHLTQEQLSEYIDTVPSTISHIERGTTKCSLPNLVKICNVLDISLDQVLGDSLTTIHPMVLDNDIFELLQDCSIQERKIIKEIVRCTKSALRKNKY
jgi:transcriptional regulator with XRE-family HTH domain